MSEPTRYPALPDHLELDRCPHCGVAKPFLSSRLRGAQNLPDIIRTDDQSYFWYVYQCSSCYGAVLTYWYIYIDGSGSRRGFSLLTTFPENRKVPSDLPESAQRFLRQAFETLHAPDAAILCAASAIDAMLKEKGLHDGSLYNRLERAVEMSVITQEMAEWAHHVRLEANDSRHVDDTTAPPTQEQAQVCIQFAEALADILFVLPSKVSRGIKDAKNSLQH